MQFSKLSTGSEASHECGISASKVYCWGYNNYGQLGDGTTTNRSVPTAVVTAGTPMDGKSIVDVATGESFTIALASDSTMYTWGYNGTGALGNNSNTNSTVPVAVIASGVLNGKTITKVAAGEYHSVALASDGTVYAWGNNGYGQLGNNTTTTSYAPVAVITTGALSGKTIIQVTAGSYYTVALASDGTVYAWGSNGYGQLGDGTTTSHYVPTAVTTAGTPMDGKNIVNIASGRIYSVALASDGTVYSWGDNTYGELGNGDRGSPAIYTAQSNVPVAVITTGALSGKTIVQVAAGYYNTVALASDGTVYSWGYGGQGELGNNTSADSPVPVAVITTGVLSGRTITQVAAISWNSLVLSSDGTVYGWGRNSYGVLANNSGVPVATAGKPLPLDVTFGGNAVTVFNQTNNSFQFITPAHNVGFVDMDIAATQYTAAAHASNIYEYVLPPVINSINPNTGYTTGGDSVTILGKNFSSDNIITFNGLPATITNVSYDGDSITVTTPSHYAGNVDVVVSDILGQKSTFKNGFTYIEDSPTVTSISPTYGPEKGSQSVTINGTNFIKKYKFTSFANGSAAYHTCGIDDGKVYCWGLNDHGQIGDGTGTSQASPVAVTTSGVLAGKTITQVAVGIYHTVALSSDGTVYTWGNNEYGQLGNNTTTSSKVPVAVTTTGALSGKTIIQVAAGYEHTVALASDGTVYTWGLNNYGQLGNGTTGSSSTPIAVVTAGTPMDSKNIVDVSVGQYHTAALSSDGTVYAWGYNNYGQLGNNSTTNSSIPVAVTSTGVLSGKTIIQVAAGYEHTVALASDGTVYTWGLNNYGQLGNGTTGSSSTPIAVVTAGTPMDSKNIINIAAGGYHTVTLASDSTVYTWGYNSYGQLGNGTSTNSLIPVAVATSGALSGKSITNVYATLYSSYALASNDVPYSWGYNGLGQLGDGTTTNRTTPVSVDLTNTPYTVPNIYLDNNLLTNIQYVSSTQLTGVTPAHTAGIVDLKVTNYDGQSATLSNAYTYIAAPTITSLSQTSGLVAGGDTITIYGTNFNANTKLYFGSVQATISHISGTKIIATVPASSVSGRVAVYVVNPDGQRGYYNNGYVYKTASSSVSISPNKGPMKGGTAVTITGSNLTQNISVYASQVEASTNNSYAIVDGNVYSWGDNTYGQLGNGTLTASTSPVPVKTYGTPMYGKTITKVSAGSNFVLALASDGTVYSWGINANGQLGNNSTTNSSLPVQITALSGVTDIAAGDNHALAVINGKVYAWGYNNNGQLGDGTTTTALAPELITGILSGQVTKVSAGGAFSMALDTNNNTIYTWGLGTSGQLGNGTVTSSSIPVLTTMTGVLSGKTITAISAGNNHALVLSSDGTVYSWGDNTYGELGNNTTASSSVPVLAIYN